MMWFNLLDHGLWLAHLAQPGFRLCGVGDIKGFGFLESQEGDEEGFDGADVVR